MQDVLSTRSVPGWSHGRALWARMLEYLPRGNTLDDDAWRRRHRMLEVVLALHVPGLVGLGLLLGRSWVDIAEAVAVPTACLVTGHLVTHRRWASFFVTGGLVFCSMALVLLSRGSIEAHFHFFIIIGFIALYQDWVPFLWNVTFTVLSHGIGTIWLGGQIFNHPAAQQHPWLWSFIHGVAVLLACIGMVIFWRVTEDEQIAKEALGHQLLTADVEIGRRQFTSDMLVNLARRNQSMLYRQLDIINHLEDKEQDPDALSDLFKLDHLATRIRRNAESLLVLAGEQPPRAWSAPVLLRDVVRAAIAETEDLDRVVFAVDDRVAVSGAPVADLTHLVAELTENAVRFSSPETVVTIRARPNRRDDGGHVLTVEDWGVGMPTDDLAEANDLLAHPREVDLAVSQRLGFHVVSRLAARHRIAVSLTATPGSGITAVVVLPATLFAPAAAPDDAPPVPSLAAPSDGAWSGPAGEPAADADLVAPPRPAVDPEEGAWAGVPWTPAAPEPVVETGPVGPRGSWHGWWSPEDGGMFLPGELPPGFRANGGPHGAGPDTAPHGAHRNGLAPDGPATNGSSNGFGPTGARHDAPAWDDAGPDLFAADDAAPAAAIPDEAGEVVDDLAPPSDPGPAPWPAASLALPPIPDGLLQPPPRDRDGDPPQPRSTPAPEVPRARTAGPPPSPVRRPLPPVSYGVPGPVAALPSPRPDDTLVPTTPAPGGPATSSGPTTRRGLRRRVPQSHLAPELRHAANGLADTAVPLAADAAASALSRYQASRLAAQAVVDVPDGRRPEDEGGRA